MAKTFQSMLLIAFMVIVNFVTAIYAGGVKFVGTQGGISSNGLRQCLDVTGIPNDCGSSAASWQDCAYLKCSGGDVTGCVYTQDDKKPKEICDSDGDDFCKETGHGSLKHGEKVCQMCTTENCNTGKPSDGNWYSH